MEYIYIPSSDFPNRAKNVSITNETNCDLIDLTIWSINFKYPTVKIPPNSTVELSLPSGDHRFDFSFLKLDADAEFKATVTTPTETETDSASAAAAERGRLPMVVKV